MSNLLDAREEVEREFGRESMARPAAGSFALHAALGCTIVFWGILNGFFHHNSWGGTQGGGAIQVNITSAIPLPAQKVNDNVLMSETPSESPAIPETKPDQQKLDLDAVPIPGKKEKPKPVAQNIPKTQPHQPPPKPTNQVNYGERSGSVLPRSMAQAADTNGPTAVSDSGFGSRFPWYVDGINRKMSTMWNKGEVDPSTPHGAQVYIVFTIHRDGSPSEVQLDRTSGSGTLDRSCIRAAQRVDTFGQLPAAYNQSTLKVSYYCEY
jgi:periplasmic protein TonB